MHKVIGLMSGTSLDGIDAALLETDGVRLGALGAALTQPYPLDLRARLRAAIACAAKLEAGAPLPQQLREVERALTDAHADAVHALLKQAGLPAKAIFLVGFHGQTVLHRPQQRWTLQLGDGARLAQLTGIDVVHDFRTADVGAGGQGAPLVPLYHAALAAESGLPRPVAVVNIGGVANVTWVGQTGLLAFDTGPGNAPLDDWALRHTGRPLDEDARLARAGQVHEAVVEKMLAHDFFARRPPKSLDRMDFGVGSVEHLEAADGAATLTAFTAAAIAQARAHFPQPAQLWVVCGGGRHNPALMAELHQRLDAPVMTAENLGWRGDFLEAEAFAFLAARSEGGLALSLPSTTGVPEPMRGGRLCRAPRPDPRLRLSSEIP
jgi:anhydro-N-acetylmuramic acid kinase